KRAYEELSLKAREDRNSQNAGLRFVAEEKEKYRQRQTQDIVQRARERKLAKIKGDDAGDYVQDELGDKIGVEIGDEIGDEIGEKIGDEIRFKNGDKIGDKIGNEIGDKIGDKIGDEIGAEIGDNVGDNIGEKIGVKIGDESPPYLESGDAKEPPPPRVRASAAAPEGSAESLDAVRKRLHERLGKRGGGKDRASDGLRADEL
ncbi:unnamed protein product, partial [Laminaria digitata]